MTGKPDRYHGHLYDAAQRQKLRIATAEEAAASARARAHDGGGLGVIVVDKRAVYVAHEPPANPYRQVAPEPSPSPAPSRVRLHLPDDFRLVVNTGEARAELQPYRTPRPPPSEFDRVLEATSEAPDIRPLVIDYQGGLLRAARSCSTWARVQVLRVVASDAKARLALMTERAKKAINKKLPPKLRYALAPGDVTSVKIEGPCPGIPTTVLEEIEQHLQWGVELAARSGFLKEAP